MIIIILFATFVSLFFQSTQYQSSESFTEGFESDSKKGKDEDEEEEEEEKPTKKPKKENMSNDDNYEEDERMNKNPKKEGYKYSFQGEEPDISSSKEDNDLGNEMAKPQTTKTAKLKKDMEQYFEIQKELLSVLEKAEPLQQKAEAFKERFNSKKSS